MWLIKLHIAFSVLCLVTFLGFRTVFRDAIKQNGWIPETKGGEKTKQTFRISYAFLSYHEYAVRSYGTY